METKITNEPNSKDEPLVRSLYNELLEYWNQGNANSYADLFMEDGNLIGFDGSQINGRRQINTEIAQIFANHKVASYVSIVEDVRSLGSAIYVLRAVVGMVPPGGSDVIPDRNAIQTLIAVKQQDKFRIAVFHNTPAAFHGRPELSEKLTRRLQDVLKNSGSIT